MDKYTPIRSQNEIQEIASNGVLVCIDQKGRSVPQNVDITYPYIIITLTISGMAHCLYDMKDMRSFKNDLTIFLPGHIIRPLEHSEDYMQTWLLFDPAKYADSEKKFNPKEFEALYTQFLGKTPHGTAAMMVMAMEIYGRNQQEGERCIRLINYPSNVSSVLPRLKDKLCAKPGDSYGQRYLPAAVLKGATPANAYQPTSPYTVEMKASVNKHQELQFAGQGTVMYLYVMGKGWDTEQRSVEIIRQPDSQLHQVFNCPALYTGCKQIRGTWKGLK